MSQIKFFEFVLYNPLRTMQLGYYFEYDCIRLDILLISIRINYKEKLWFDFRIYK